MLASILRLQFDGFLLRNWKDLLVPLIWAAYIIFFNGKTYGDFLQNLSGDGNRRQTIKREQGFWSEGWKASADSAAAGSPE